MMKRWMLLVIAVLLVASLACSLAGRETATPEAEDQPAPEEASVATEEPAGEAPEDEAETAEDEGLFEVQSDALDELNSYRSHLTMRTEKADGTLEEVTMRQEAVREPPAQRFVMEGAEGSYEMIRIGDTNYVRMDDTWMQTSAEDSDEAFGDFMLSQDELVSGVEGSDYEYLGKEVVNGVNTKHYRSTYSESWLGDMGDDYTQVTDGTVEVWVANERDLPQFVVRFVLTMVGTYGDVEGTSTITQDVTDVNQPITIEAPEGVIGGLPEGIETYPDATDTMTLGTITMFTAPASATVAGDFYAAQFEAAGWEMTDETTAEGTVMRTYTKGDETVSLMITTEGDSESCSVMISWEKPAD